MDPNWESLRAGLVSIHMTCLPAESRQALKKSPNIGNSKIMIRRFVNNGSQSQNNIAPGRI